MKSDSNGSADESIVAQSSPLADSESMAAGLRRAGGQARGGAGRCHVAPTPSIDLELGPPLVDWACGVEGSPAVLWASAGESDSDAESAPAGPGPVARR